MQADFDVCVIGSGAGGGPVAFSLARAGRSVVVLEKGPWLREADFFKDEIACCRRPEHRPDPRHQPHVVETSTDDGAWHARPTPGSGWNFWNGNVVGGATNFMSGFFHRLKPVDLRLRSTFGPIEGANVVDWPIAWDELAPWYDVVEREVGVSGPGKPFPPLAEHPLAARVDAACAELGFASFATPRAVLTRPHEGRAPCAYTGHCGSYGCSTGAKGSSRAALLDRALATGRCEVRPESMVQRLVSDESGRVAWAEYVDARGRTRRVDARIFVVACQAVESARLLLASPGPRHPGGLANRSGQVGRNLLFAGGGAGSARFPAVEPDDTRLWINRALQDWYVIDDPGYVPEPMKGGTIDFVHRPPAPIARAIRQTRGPDGRVWGRPLKRALESHFAGGPAVKLEAFCDWLPHDDCFVTLDPDVRDRWGLPVARVRVAFHPHNLTVGWYLASRGAEVLRAMGGTDVVAYAVGRPPTNLVAGTCRFGDDPATSVLDRDCRAHDCDNLFVTDGSFLPTGGSVPYTWTIYANAFRVAERIEAQL